jgi:hypothetical protein
MTCARKRFLFYLACYTVGYWLGFYLTWSYLNGLR